MMKRRQQGFTLIEAIVVMVLLSILAGIMVLFIRKPIQQYVDASERADLSDSADLALRRMTRELHSALPNSVRLLTLTNGNMIEFIPTKSGGTYLDEADDAAGLPLSFTDSGKKEFNVVGDLPVRPANSDFVVVYNLGSGYKGADAYASIVNSPADVNRAALIAAPSPAWLTDSLSWNGTTVSSLRIRMDTSAVNPFAHYTGAVPNTSPTHRFHIVTQPVTFRCGPLTRGGPTVLSRHWNYGFNPAVMDPLGAGSSAILASNVSSCTFSYTTAANVQHGLIGLTVALTRSGSSETITLSQQVNVDNTP